MSDEMKTRVYCFCPFCGKYGHSGYVGFNNLGSIYYCKYCEKEFMINISKTYVNIERKTFIMPDFKHCILPLSNRKINKFFRKFKELIKRG